VCGSPLLSKALIDRENRGVNLLFTASNRHVARAIVTISRARPDKVFGKENKKEKNKEKGGVPDRAWSMS